jgi:hypothetical protein
MVRSGKVKERSIIETIMISIDLLILLLLFLIRAAKCVRSMPHPAQSAQNDPSVLQGKLENIILKKKE